MRSDAIRFTLAIFFGTILPSIATMALAKSVCIGPSQQTGEVTVDFCPGAAQLVDHDWEGYSTQAPHPCEVPFPNPCIIDYLPGFGGLAWYVSRSISDPSVTFGPLTSNTLYLWLRCASHLAPERFRASLVGDLAIASVQGMNGITNNGSGSEIDLAFFGGCPSGPLPVARINLVPVVATPEPEVSSWGRAKALYR